MARGRPTPASPDLRLRRGIGRRKPSGPLGEGGPHIQDEAPLQDRRVALGGRFLPSWSALPNLPPRRTTNGRALGKGGPATNLQSFAPQVLRA